MEIRELLFGLHEMEGIGWKSIDKIRRAGLLTNAVFSCSAEEWELAGISGVISARLAADFNDAWVQRRLSLMKESGVAMVTILDDHYPVQLRETLSRLGYCTTEAVWSWLPVPLLLWWGPGCLPLMGARWGRCWRDS